MGCGHQHTKTKSLYTTKLDICDDTNGNNNVNHNNNILEIED